MNPRLKWGIVAAVLVAAIFFWRATAGSGGTDWPVRNDPPADGELIVAVGDSLTEGYGVQPGQRWTEYLAEKLGRPIENRGRNGERSAQTLERLDADVIALNPRIAIVCIGGNDLLADRPAAETREKVKAIVARIQESGALVVLVGVDSPAVKFTALGIGRRLENAGKYEPMYRQLAEELGCAYMPNILEGLSLNPGMTLDNIHPTPKGHAAIAERMDREVGEYLRR